MPLFYITVRDCAASEVAAFARTRVGYPKPAFWRMRLQLNPAWVAAFARTRVGYPKQLNPAWEAAFARTRLGYPKPAFWRTRLQGAGSALPPVAWQELGSSGRI